MGNKNKNSASKTTPSAPPVVAVLGHVDHGKTTLLDAIRKTNVAEKERGGITQKIGASIVETKHDGKIRGITFIDTPGHETFFRIRSRGAQVADIGLLVVSSADGVMPQTKESIKLLLDAKIPFIVVFTKSDLPDKNTEKVKQQLLKEGVMLEGLGGDIPFIAVSAKTNSNIKELLDLILLVYDMKLAEFAVKTEKDVFRGVIIESKLDQKVGPKATMIVKNGTVSLREELACDDGSIARIKALISPTGQGVKNASTGEAVEILGFEKVPDVGSLVMKRKDAVNYRGDVSRKESEILDTSYSPHADKDTLSLIICADNLSSVEAIVDSLPEKVSLVSKKTGEIATSDVLLAKSVGAIILGFNVPIKNEIIELARTEKVPVKGYNIIYELIDEVKDVIEGKALSLQEEIFGKAKVLASFPFEKTQVLGVLVLEGRVARGDRVRLMRGETILGESVISSLRQGKNVVSRVEKGKEAGAIISPFLDFTIGDVLICHS